MAWAGVQNANSAHSATSRMAVSPLPQRLFRWGRGLGEGAALGAAAASRFSRAAPSPQPSPPTVKLSGERELCALSRTAVSPLPQRLFRWGRGLGEGAALGAAAASRFSRAAPSPQPSPPTVKLSGERELFALSVKLSGEKKLDVLAVSEELV